MPKVIVRDVLTAAGPNVQATRSASVANARSESVVVVHPSDPQRIVGASKKFASLTRYDFTLAVCYSDDGGASWGEAPPLALGTDRHGVTWGGISDPALTWDSVGNVHLLALPFGQNDGPTLGIALYSSSDAGHTWSGPTTLHTGDDDKQWIAADLHPGSPHHGNIYAAWDLGSSMVFARSTDHGVTWRGIGTKSVAESIIADDSFSPEISVGPDGTVFIVYWNRYASGGPRQVKLVRSVDGGDSFAVPQIVADGITDLEQVLPKLSGWAHFPEATFRVLTVATACVGASGELEVAWADGREVVGVSDVSAGSHIARIYRRRSPDGGQTWEGPPSGEPLGVAPLNQWTHQFHPQLASSPAGEIGCAFYESGWTTGADGNSHYLIDVRLAVSRDHGTTFPTVATVTSSPWDPAVAAPLVHGLTGVTFIGEYFGLDAGPAGFTTLWTDTRTGTQELFSATHAITREYIVDGELGGVIFGGVDVGGGGWILLPGGRLRPVPPREPIIDVLALVDAYQAASELLDPDEHVSAQREALRGIVRIAQRMLEQ